jgi:ribosomal protein S18 acetylase RimI-like enzyme
MAGDAVELEFTLRPDPGDMAALSNGLDAFNATVPLAADRAKVSLAVFLRQAGQVVGGAYGDTHYGWLYLGSLWVEKSLRGTGWGRQLLGRFEAEGAALGARSVWVDTYGFQAPGFYERLGYREFGRLDDFPPGSARHFLWKALGEFGE